MCYKTYQLKKVKLRQDVHSENVKVLLIIKLDINDKTS